jgi:hypothetical protein
MVGLLYRLVQISGTRFKRYSHAKRFLPCRAFGSIQCFGDSRCVSFLPSKCFQGPNGLVHQKQYWLGVSRLPEAAAVYVVLSLPIFRLAPAVFIPWRVGTEESGAVN